MPKQTFLNLTNEKQNKIIDAARNEFSDNSFYEASINKIIKDAGIPRGSFYQYFDSKEDLFLYLFEQCTNRFLEEVGNQLKTKECDLFECYLLIFDVVTRGNVDESWKPFLVTTISNMNMKLMFHLEKFLMAGDFSYPMEGIGLMFPWEEYQCKNQEEKRAIHHLIANTTIPIIGICLHDMERVEYYRDGLCHQFELIKYGVMR